MTNSKNIPKKIVARIATLILCILSTVLALLFSSELKASIIIGMKLAAIKIIPTLFPFMVISDFWMCSINFDKKNKAGYAFEKIFKINKNALIAFITGIFAGFPMGVKTSVDLYNNSIITKDELERLAPIINLPSFAFVISGVGLGLYRDIKIGFVLYFSVVSSSVFYGIIKGLNKNYSHFSGNNIRQTFNLTSSIKQAGYSSITISSYIIFFSGLLGLVSVLAKNDILLSVISSFIEVGNATSIISKNCRLPNDFALIVTSFALGFSGLSVHLQAFNFLPEDISKRKYIFSKLIIGIFSSIITAAFVYAY